MPPLPRPCIASNNHLRHRDMDGSILGFTAPSSPTSPVGGFIAGSFTPTSGSVVGLSSTTLGRSYPYDQGIPLPHGPCSYDPTWKGYKCSSNSSAFVTPPMDLTFKPSPIPPSGIFGDPQLFVLESRCASLSHFLLFLLALISPLLSRLSLHFSHRY